MFLAVLVSASLLLHYGFAAFDLLPAGSTAGAVTDRTFFAIDYTFWLNLVFIGLSLFFLVWKARTTGLAPAIPQAWGERVLLGFSVLAYGWLAIGLGLAAG